MSSNNPVKMTAPPVEPTYAGLGSTQTPRSGGGTMNTKRLGSQILGVDADKANDPNGGLSLEDLMMLSPKGFARFKETGEFPFGGVDSIRALTVGNVFPSDQHTALARKIADLHGLDFARVTDRTVDLKNAAGASDYLGGKK